MGLLGPLLLRYYYWWFKLLHCNLLAWGHPDLVCLQNRGAYHSTTISMAQNTVASAANLLWTFFNSRKKHFNAIAINLHAWVFSTDWQMSLTKGKSVFFYSWQLIICCNSCNCETLTPNVILFEWQLSLSGDPVSGFSWHRIEDRVFGSSKTLHLLWEKAPNRLAISIYIAPKTWFGSSW
jgi:hypothetical protein